MDGPQYVRTGLESDWVKNARADGWGILARGRRAERVRRVEVPVEEHAPIPLEFPRQVPYAIEFLDRNLGRPNDTERLAVAPRCPVSRFDPMPKENQENAPTACGSGQ